MNGQIWCFLWCITLGLFVFPASAIDLSWEEATEHAAFSPRGFFSVADFENKIWVIGGLNQNGSEKFYNDVWVSSDGVTWDLATGSAGFTPRYGHTTVVHNGKIWVIGGYDIGHNFKNDVWFSEDGKNWKQATPRAAFRPRLLHTSFIYNDKMWVIGGEVTEHPWIYTNDVWYSSDGITWNKATGAAPFSPRIAHISVEHEGKMLVIGGVGDAYGKVRFNDVWSSSDGVVWRRETEHAGFTSRYSMTSVATNEKIFIFGGFDGTSPLNETWSSSDGATWLPDTSEDCFSARYGHRAVFFNDMIWVIGGTNFHNDYFNDVWHSSEIAPVAPGSKMSVKKTVSPWSVKQGTDTRITISYTNAGSAPVHDIEILDTVPEAFLLIDGEPGISGPQSLMPNETRILVYTLRATRPGVYTLPRTSVLYAADDGNYYKTASNAPEVKVIAPLIADDAPSSNDPQSFLDELWQEMTTFLSIEGKNRS